MEIMTDEHSVELEENIDFDHDQDDDDDDDNDATHRALEDGVDSHTHNDNERSSTGHAPQPSTHMHQTRTAVPTPRYQNASSMPTTTTSPRNQHHQRIGVPYDTSSLTTAMANPNSVSESFTNTTGVYSFSTGMPSISPFSPLWNRKRRRSSNNNALPMDPSGGGFFASSSTSLASDPKRFPTTTIDLKDEAMADLSLSVCRKVSVVVTVCESTPAKTTTVKISMGSTSATSSSRTEETLVQQQQQSNQVCLFPSTERLDPSDTTMMTSTAAPNNNTSNATLRDLIVVNPDAFGKQIPVSVTMDTARLVAEMAHMPSEDWARTYRFHQVLWSSSTGGDCTKHDSSTYAVNMSNHPPQHQTVDALHKLAHAVVNDLVAPGSIAHRILLGTATGAVAVQQQTMQLFGNVGDQSVAQVLSEPDTGMGVADMLHRFGLAGLTVNGILERLSANSAPPNCPFACSISILEVSNEERLFDLLTNKPFAVKGATRVDFRYEDSGAVLIGLSESLVDSLKQAGRLMRRAFSVALHKDRRSARGHIILTINVFDKTNPSKRTVCHFVDLAAVGRDENSLLSRRNATNRKSLTSLGGVLRGVMLKDAGHDAPISYRESVLTKVLQRSLVQTDSRTVVLATVSPDVTQYEFTMSTLRFMNGLLHRPGQVIHSPFALLNSRQTTQSSPMHSVKPMNLDANQFVGRERILLQELVSDPRQRLAKVMNPPHSSDVAPQKIEGYRATPYSNPLNIARPYKAVLRDQGSILSASPRESEALVGLNDDWAPVDSGIPTPLARNLSKKLTKLPKSILPEIGQCFVDDDNEDDLFADNVNDVSALHQILCVTERSPEVSPLMAEDGRASAYVSRSFNPFDDFLNESHNPFDDVLNESQTLENMAAHIVKIQESSPARPSSLDKVVAQKLESDASMKRIEVPLPIPPNGETISSRSSGPSILDGRTTSQVSSIYKQVSVEAANAIATDVPSVTGDNPGSNKKMGRNGVFAGARSLDDSAPVWNDEVSYLSLSSRIYERIDREGPYDGDPQFHDELEHILRERSFSGEHDVNASVRIEEFYNTECDKSLESILRERECDPESNDRNLVGQTQLLDQHPQNPFDVAINTDLDDEIFTHEFKKADAQRKVELVLDDLSRQSMDTSRNRDSKSIDLEDRLPHNAPLVNEPFDVVENGHSSNRLSTGFADIMDRTVALDDEDFGFDKEFPLATYDLPPDSPSGGLASADQRTRTPLITNATMKKLGIYNTLGVGESLVHTLIISGANPTRVKLGEREAEIQRPSLNLPKRDGSNFTSHGIPNGETFVDHSEPTKTSEVSWQTDTYGPTRDVDLGAVVKSKPQESTLSMVDAVPPLTSYDLPSPEESVPSGRQYGREMIQDLEVDTNLDRAAYSHSLSHTMGSPMVNAGVNAASANDRDVNAASENDRGLFTDQIQPLSTAVSQMNARFNDVTTIVNAPIVHLDDAVTSTSVMRPPKLSPATRNTLRDSFNGATSLDDSTQANGILIPLQDHSAASNTEGSKTSKIPDVLSGGRMPMTSDRTILDEIDNLQAAVDKVKQTNVNVWQSSLTSFDNLRSFQISQRKAIARLSLDRDNANHEVLRLRIELERQAESHRSSMSQIQGEVEAVRNEIENARVDRVEVVKIAEEAIATQAELEERVDELEEQLSAQVHNSVPRDEFVKLEKVLDIREKEIEVTNERGLQYNEELSDRNLLITKLQRLLSNVKEECKRLENELLSCRSEIDSLNAELSLSLVAKEDATNLRSEASDLNIKIHSLEAAMRDIEAQLQSETDNNVTDSQRMREEMENVEQKLAEATSLWHFEAAGHQAEIGRLLTELNDLQDDRGIHQSKQQDIEQKLIAALEHKDEVQSELVRTRSALENRVSDVQELMNSLTQLASDKEKDQNQIVHMEKALSLFQDETRSRVEKVVHYRNEAASLLEKTVNENKALVVSNQQLQVAMEEMRRELDTVAFLPGNSDANQAKELEDVKQENLTLMVANQQLLLELDSLQLQLDTKDLNSSSRSRRAVEDVRTNPTETTHVQNSIRQQDARASLRHQPRGLSLNEEDINSLQRTDRSQRNNELSDLERVEAVAAYVAFSAKSKLQRKDMESYDLKHKIFALEDEKDDEINSLKVRIKSLERRFLEPEPHRRTAW